MRAESRKADFTRQQTAFEAMVADLRGDGNNVDVLKRTLATVNVEELLSLGYRVNHDVVEKLPDFERINAYLEGKTQKHLATMTEMVGRLVPHSLPSLSLSRSLSLSLSLSLSSPLSLSLRWRWWVASSLP